MRFKILRRISKGTWHTFVKSVEILVAFLGVSLGLIFWRLYTEPLDAAFLLPELTKRMIPADAGIEVSAESIMLRASLKAQGLFHLDVRHLTITRADGSEMISLPSVEMSYGLGNIMTFNYVPQTIQIDKAMVQLVIDEEGRLFLMNAAAGQEDENEKPSDAALERHKAPQRVQTNLSALARFLQGFDYLGIQDASLVIDDRQKNETFSIPKLNLIYEKEIGFRRSLEGTAVLRVNDALINVGLEAELKSFSKELSFELISSPIRLNRLGRFIPELAGANLPVKMTINGMLDLKRTVQHPRQYVSGLSFQLEGVKAGTLSLPAPLTNVYQVRSLLINGQFGTDLSEVHIDKSYAVLKEGVKAKIAIDTTGLATYFDTGDLSAVKTVLTSVVEDIPIKLVPRLCPAALGPDAHAWVAENLTTGFAPRGDFKLTLQGGQLVDVQGKIDVRGVSVRYLPDIPEITGVNGEVLLTLDEVVIHGTSGNQGALQLQKADVYLTELDKDISRAKIDIDARGPVQEAMRLIALPPFEFPQIFGLNPEQTGGFTSVSMTLDFPLTEALTVSDVSVDLTADIIDGLAVIPNTDLILKDGKLVLTVQTKGLHLSGTGTVNQIPLTLDWHESFLAKKPQEIQTTFNLKTGVTEKEVSAVFPDMPPCFNGRATGEVSLKRQVKGGMSGEARLDLTDAALEIAPLSVMKDVGEKLAFQGNYTLTPDGKSGSLTGALMGAAAGEPLNVKGLVAWGDKIQIDLPEVSAKGTDISLKAEVEPERHVALYVRGKAWNLSGLFHEKEARKPAEKTVSQAPQEHVKIPNVQERPPDISVDVRLDTLFLNPDLPLQDIILKGERQGYFWQNFTMEMQGAVPFRADFNPRHRHLRASTKNLGDLLNRLNLTNEIEGGVLSLQAGQPPSGGLLGTINVKNFSVKDPGFFVQAFTILGIVDAIRGKELQFKKAEIPFELTPYQSLFITEGYAYGTTLGITVTGRARPDALDFNGSVIPAYAVNSLLGKIPLIGGLFRDGEGGGLVGVKYTLKGPMTAPEISFNTLSSMAPGIIGKLFK